MSLDDFTDDQKQYLQGFVSGAELGRAARNLATFAATLGLDAGPAVAAPMAGKAGPGQAAPAGPDAVHALARDRTIAEGKKLSALEDYKRKRNPLDLWVDLA